MVLISLVIKTITMCHNLPYAKAVKNVEKCEKNVIVFTGWQQMNQKLPITCRIYCRKDGFLSLLNYFFLVIGRTHVNS